MSETIALIEVGIVGVGRRTKDGKVLCCRCRYEADWADCCAGCDDGYFDGYEEDPLWYDEGELVFTGGHGIQIILIGRNHAGAEQRPQRQSKQFPNQWQSGCGFITTS